MTRRRPPSIVVWTFVVLLAAAVQQSGSAQQASVAEWRTFEGSWSAVGQRYTVPTEGERPAAVVQITGAVVLKDGAGANLGFHGVAIGFDNGTGLSGGRVLWIDGHGNRLYSTIRGDSIETRQRITGTITGGTGPYAGAAGDYSLTWQYVVAGDDNTIQGRAVDIKGRFRSIAKQP